MKGAMLYVDAGKGHYTPAKALADSFIRAGHEATVENLLLVFGSRFWNAISKYSWRLMLHFPRLEPLLTNSIDSKFNAYLMRRVVELEKHLRAFSTWIERTQPDFIISTNFIGGAILPIAIEKLHLDIPVYQYLADVFDTPRIGINNKLTRMYSPSELGKENAVKRGQDPSSISVCSFPIQYKFESYDFKGKTEARKALELEDRFTILCSLGGEGIGTAHLLYKLAESNIDCQVVTIGGHSRTTDKSFADFRKKYPDFLLQQRGFVDNVPDYLAACDLQIGKAGANGVMESIYMHRPFIVTQVLYPFEASLDFLKEHPVGWGENDEDRQIEIIKEYAGNKELRDRIEAEFSSLPLSFGADAFRDQIIKDTEEFRKKL